MKERPILFNGSMVRAILEGRKTKTRRVADTGLYAIDGAIHGAEVAERERAALLTRHLHGQPGDRLWVRETFATLAPGSYEEEVPRKIPGQILRYAANSEDAALARCNDQRWRPSNHMPRWASRITLEINATRIERLQDITEEDAKAEGIEREEGSAHWKNYEVGPGWRYWESPIQSFRTLWDSIYGTDQEKRWDANPWVWVTAFGRAGNVTNRIPCNAGEAPCSMHTIMREHKEAPDPSP